MKPNQIKITSEHLKAAETLRQLIVDMGGALLRQGGSLAELEQITDCKVSVFLTMVETYDGRATPQQTTGGDL